MELATPEAIFDRQEKEDVCFIIFLLILIDQKREQRAEMLPKMCVVIDKSLQLDFFM